MFCSRVLHRTVTSLCFYMGRTQSVDNISGIVWQKVAKIISINVVCDKQQKFEGGDWGGSIFYVTQRTAMKIPFLYSFSGNCAASVSISTFMCLSVSDLFIPRIGPHISCIRIGQIDGGNI
jgi:hypothetical protein